MKYRIILKAVFMGLLALPLQALSGSMSEIEARYTQLHAAEQAALSLGDAHARNARIAERYQVLFAGLFAQTALKAATVTDLHFLFQAARVPAFYTSEARYVDDMRRVLDALAQHNAVTDREREEMYVSLLSLRDFAAAQALLQQSPQLHIDSPPVVPAGFDNPKVTAFDVDTSANMLMPLQLDVTHGEQLVVIAHPLCGFSRNAVAAIEQDPAFARLLAATTIWLAPVNGRLYLTEFRDWNGAHPHTRIVQAWHASSWPMITDWASPQFYLLRDGKVVAHVVGWPKQGRKQELMALLEKMHGPE